jgi:bifunctional UDP-N-acetylglucosamine pyrophosphorylase / glucosamine-1-phosphate N-acetyltransferase
MKNKSKQYVAAIILAAGRGRRMQMSEETNKVTIPLAGKPMILHTIHTLQSIHVNPIIVVVGFAKQSVKDVLKEEAILYAEQDEQKGSAHAVEVGLTALTDTCENVIVLNGDDSAFYTPEVFRQLLKQHIKNKNGFTFLTIAVQTPFGIGRIIRDANGVVTKIVEEKDATDRERETKEINPVCYIFNTAFLRKYIREIQKSPVTGEYYITDIVAIARMHNEKVEAVRKENIVWRGVNTKEELGEAEALMKGK